MSTLRRTTIACDGCKRTHPAPACKPGAEPVDVLVTLPPWLHAIFAEHVPWGERSPWIVGLIRRELVADGEAR